MQVKLRTFSRFSFTPKAHLSVFGGAIAKLELNQLRYWHPKRFPEQKALIKVVQGVLTNSLKPHWTNPQSGETLKARAIIEEYSQIIDVSLGMVRKAKKLISE